jgi:hypothetical protein
MILDHHNLFIYIDKRYLMFYHDINIICHSTIYWKCCQNFTHDDEYFEYLLKDLKYLGEKMFIVCKIGRWELLLDVMAWCCPNLQHWTTHVVWNPCGIRNWWTLKKTKMLTEIYIYIYIYSKPNFLNIFQVGALITNYLHRHYMNLTHMRSSWNTTVTLLHMVGQETISYKSKLALIFNVGFKV